MKNIRKYLLAGVAGLLCFIIMSFTGDDNVYTVAGRTTTENGGIVLISPASSVTFGFTGNNCTVKLVASDVTEHHNYAVLELDGEYYGRFKIEPKGSSIKVTAHGKKGHTLSVYKATEAANGKVIFMEATGTLFRVAPTPKKKIEFIGDSITVGMGNDESALPCGSGQWYDQHNAYYSYAPVTARMLGADYTVNAVSGIGMYRNWNDEHKDEPTMPQVYENLYLNRGATQPYGFGFKPDVTCIALGTNDFSNGDGKKERLPFNAKQYTEHYLEFINTVYRHSPDTQVVLLNSPMVTGQNADLFLKCLNEVKEQANAKPGHKPIVIFTFTNVTPTGCTTHPAIKEDKELAVQLSSFLKQFM